MKSLNELEENIIAVFPELKNMSKKERAEWNFSTKSSVEKKKRKILKKLVPKDRRDKLGDSLANRYSIILNGDYDSEDFFFFNEFNIANQSGSLYDIDKKEFLYQEKAKAKMGRKSPKKREYKYPMLSYWVRVINGNGELCYVSLESLASSVFYKLENKVSNYIDKLIPSLFVALPDNGQKSKSKTMGSLFLWSYHSCPKDLSQSYIKNCMDYFRMHLTIGLFYSLQGKLDKKGLLIVKTKKKKGKEKDDKTSKDMTVVFSNVNQLKKVNTKTFLSDLKKLKKSDPSLIRKIAKKEFKPIKRKIDNKLKSLKHEMVYKEVLGIISKAIDSKKKPFSKKDYLRELKALLSSNITEQNRNKAIQLFVTPLIQFISKKQLSREIETIASDICLSIRLPETKNKKYSKSLKKNRIDSVLSYAKKMKKSNDYKNSISLRMTTINASKFLINGDL